MKNIYIKAIADRIGVKEWQVENCAKLFEEGATIPFVSRYRKERTGGLAEVAVAEIRHWADAFAELEKRKTTILETISQAGGLTPELKIKIENSVESREVEDLYLPFKPKRRTRATAAKEAGLEPLADKMYNVSLVDPVPEARRFVGPKVASVDDALAGARDIIAERLSETPSVRETLRQIFKTRRSYYETLSGNDICRTGRRKEQSREAVQRDTGNGAEAGYVPRKAFQSPAGIIQTHAGCSAFQYLF